MLSNNNITLRAIEETDLKIIHSWRNKESIQPYVREYRELSLTHIKSWYENMIMDKRFEFFLIEENQTPIGVTGLTYIDWVNKHADLHLGLYEKSWGDVYYGSIIMNLMLEYGFNSLNLNKIYAEIYSIDNSKIDLFTKYKYKLDAVLREHYFYKGKYIDSHIYSLLKSEYEKH